MTIFEKIINKEIPAKIAFENEHVLAFHDISPQAKVHVLVIPKSKIQSFVQVKSSDAKALTELMRGISLTAESLGLDNDGYRVAFNCGENGGQTIEYLHAHILGGEKLPAWTK